MAGQNPLVMLPEMSGAQGSWPASN